MAQLDKVPLLKRQLVTEPCVVCGELVVWYILRLKNGKTVSRLVIPCPNKCLNTKPKEV